MPDTFLSLLLKQLQEETDSLARALLNGGASDFAAYTMICGKIHGLATAQRLVGDMQARLQHED